MDRPVRRTTWRGDEYAGESAHHRLYDDWFLDRLPPERGDVVVDLGCGSGEFSARLAELVDAGHVIGVDPDPSMLEAARRHESSNLEFISASAEDLHEFLEADSVDLVVSRAMLHWLPITAYPRVFAAVIRVLEPGGWFHSESGGAGNVPELKELLDEVAGRFGLPPLPGFPDAGVGLDLVDAAGFELPDEGVRTVAQRRPFTREGLVGFLETQATVALTRGAPEGLADDIVKETVAEASRLRRPDGTYDQTFVRLEILARRPEE